MKPEATRGWRIGVDIGGTFTDFAFERGDGLPVVVEKTLSTPADRSLGVMDGLERLAARESLSLAAFLARVSAIVHGTTVADNTLIEGNGAITGLITTAGFRDELELRRGFKEDIWDVRLPAPRPLVPRRRRLTVPERIRFDGSVHTPLDEHAARRALRELRAQGVESLAIATLFSFVNPVHELRLAELAREELPGVPLSLSHEVMPKSPEYERTSTTVVNAYIGPRVSAYLDRLAERLREAGFARELLVMQASGGVMTREYLRAAPVRVLASGPAAGVVGAAELARAKRVPDLLCIDMGGTSYDVSVVRGGMAPAETGWSWHHRAVIGLPMIRVETLGAGGGSLCHVERGVLRVGPESAGAEPGPVCYGRGGDRPTVTDALLVLGVLSEERALADGRMRLTRSGVDEAFAKYIADPLGVSIEQAAFDCWRVVNANMTQAVRRSTAARGIDPRELTLLAYGGNGPAFAAIQAQELAIARVLVPKASPAFSALGALAAEAALDEERAYLRTLGSADVRELARLWAELAARAEHFLGAAGFGPSQIHARYCVSLRYPGQNWSLAIDAAPAGLLGDREFATPALLGALRERFHARHEAEYGHRRESEEPEVTGVRLIASGEIAKPARRTAEASAPPPPRDAPIRARRRANLGRGFEEIAIVDGAALVPGDFVRAPAVIEERFTTIVVYPGWQARVDGAGDYLMERGA